jgi:hypothetical protein
MKKNEVYRNTAKNRKPSMIYSTDRGARNPLFEFPRGSSDAAVSCPVEQFREAGRALHRKAHSFTQIDPIDLKEKTK